ncbi:MAG: hypothetical protein HY587_07070 [Candidatus Omnitrophica bacterium]|nr:hypothetical protein [Candidatus Omnitrophota bacterium]
MIEALNQRGLLNQVPKLILDGTGRSYEEYAALNFIGLHLARLGFAEALGRNWLDPTEDAVRFTTYRPTASLMSNLSAVYAAYITALQAISVSA